MLPSIAKVNSKFNECGLGKYIDALYVNTRYLIFQRLFPRQECLNTKANYFSKVQYERKHELVSWQTYKQPDRKKNNIIGREYFQISQKHLKTVSPALLYTIDGFISTQIVFFSISVYWFLIVFSRLIGKDSVIFPSNVNSTYTDRSWNWTLPFLIKAWINMKKIMII